MKRAWGRGVQVTWEEGLGREERRVRLQVHTFSQNFLKIWAGDANSGTHGSPMKLPSGPWEWGMHRRSVPVARFQPFKLCSSPRMKAGRERSRLGLVKLWVARGWTGSFLTSFAWGPSGPGARIPLGFCCHPAARSGQTRPRPLANHHRQVRTKLAATRPSPAARGIRARLAPAGEPPQPQTKSLVPCPPPRQD